MLNLSMIVRFRDGVREIEFCVEVSRSEEKVLEVFGDKEGGLCMVEMISKLFMVLLC